MDFLDTAFRFKTKQSQAIVRYLDLSISNARDNSSDNEWGNNSISDDNYNSLELKLLEKFIELSTHRVKLSLSEKLSEDLKELHGIEAEQMANSMLLNESILQKHKYLSDLYHNLGKKSEEDLINSSAWRRIIRKIFPRIKFQVYALNHSKEGSNILINSILLRANLIAARSRRGPGDFIICSNSVSSLIQDHTSFVYSGMSGLIYPGGKIYYVGSIGNKIAVFVDPMKSYKDTSILVGRTTKENEHGVYFIEKEDSEKIESFKNEADPDKTDIFLSEKMAVVEIGESKRNFIRFEVSFTKKPLWKKILCL